MFSPEEIDKVRFTRALYGYSPLEVDGFLSHIKTVVTELCRENETLRAALGDSRFEGAKQRLGKTELERELAVTSRKLAEAAAVSETLKIEVAELRRELAEAGNTTPADGTEGEEEYEEEAVEEEMVAEETVEDETAEEAAAEDETVVEDADEAEDEQSADIYTAPDDEYGEDEIPSEDANDGAAEEQKDELDDIYSDLEKMLVDWDEETDGADILDSLLTDDAPADVIINEAAPDDNNDNNDNNGNEGDSGDTDTGDDMMDDDIPKILLPRPDQDDEEDADVGADADMSEFNRLFRFGTEHSEEDDDLRDLYEIGAFEDGHKDNAESAPPQEPAPEVTPTVYKKKTYHIKKKSGKKAPAKRDAQETPDQEKEDEDILAALKSEYNTYNYIFGDGKK